MEMSWAAKSYIIDFQMLPQQFTGFESYSSY